MGRHREGDVPLTALRAEALSNIAMLTHIQISTYHLIQKHESTCATNTSM